MEHATAEEVRRRNERATADHVQDALRSALCELLVEMAALKGVDSLDDFLARRLFMVQSLRTPRPWEPKALTAVRERDAAAIEAAMRGVVHAARGRCGAKTGPA